MEPHLKRSSTMVPQTKNRETDEKPTVLRGSSAKKEEKSQEMFKKKNEGLFLWFPLSCFFFCGRLKAGENDSARAIYSC